jgi:hypothetical protein
MTWTKIAVVIAALWIGLGIVAVVAWTSNDHGYSGPTITVKK